jgi:hypothetical protein
MRESENRVDSSSTLPLFDESGKVNLEELVLCGLGEFQTRKKQLAGRELPLDRLLGAFRRVAFGKFHLAFLPEDEQIAKALENLGAKVKKLPSFRAKHPFLVSVEEKLAKRALEFFEKMEENELKEKRRAKKKKMEGNEPENPAR